MKKVILGGTFDILHRGHEVLFKKAFSLGKVTIGLTSDQFAKKLKKRIVTNFSERKKNLERFIFERFGKKPKIVKIDDIFGPTLKSDFDYLIVSSETYKNGLKINQKRKSLGKEPIKILKVKMVMAEDGKPISSTRIIKGEIDNVGRKCLFCKIVDGEIDALRIFENDRFLAFLDKFPRNPGHTLIIPKEHFRWVWEIPYIDEYFKVAKRIVKALQKVFETEWIIAPILGDEVHHAHLHLIPRFKGDNFYYVPPKIKKIPFSEMKIIQKKIKNALNKV